MTSNESAQCPKWSRVKGNHYEKRDISFTVMKTDHRNISNNRAYSKQYFLYGLGEQEQDS